MGPPLFEALIANLLVILCDVDAFLHWNSSAEEGACVGLKTGPPRRHRIQPVEGPVLDPLAKETCFQKGSKSGPLEIKSVPPWRVQFLVPFLAPSLSQILLKRLFQVEADLISSSCGWNLELGRPIFARPLFRTF